MENMRIRVLDEQDTDIFKKFLLDYDFASGEDAIFSWYRSLETTTMFRGDIGGSLIGTGISFSVGNTGWIGGICVDRNHRQKGIGRALTQYAVDRLRAQGATSILLRASQEGIPMYSTMGFVETGTYENFLVPPVKWPELNEPELEIREIDRLTHEHIELDSESSGEDRGEMLTRLPSAKGFEFRRFGLMQGFVYPTVGDGFLAVSRTEEIIPHMMTRIADEKKFKIRTLKGSIGNSYLHALGFEPTDGAVRMVLGTEPLKNFKKVAGTISSSIG